MVSIEKVVSSGVFAGLGLGGVVVGLVDAYQDLLLQGEPPATVALENTVPVALGVVLLWLAWDVYWRGNDVEFVSTVAKMSFISVVGVGFVGSWVVGIQLVQGALKPLIILLDTLVAVAVLGTIAGINEAERNVERDRFETLAQQADHPVAETYVDDGLVVSATNEPFRDTFGDGSPARFGTQTTRTHAEAALVDLVDFVDEDPLAGVFPSLERGETVEREVRVAVHGEPHDYTLRLAPVSGTADPLEVSVVFVPANSE